MDKNDFNLRYLAHYRIKDVDLYQDILLCNNAGSIDQYLFNLSLFTKDKKDFKVLNNIYIEKQLCKVKKLYEVKTGMHKTLIVSKELNGIKNEIEIIRFRLDCLLKIKKDLKDFLYNLIGAKRSSKNQINIESIEGNAPDKYFTGREIELKQLEESFEKYQYVYIHGRSGYGKTTLALEYASNIKKKSNQIIRWINNSSLNNSFINLAEELRINISEKLKFNLLL